MGTELLRRQRGGRVRGVPRGFEPDGLVVSHRPSVARVDDVEVTEEPVQNEVGFQIR